MAKTNNGAHDMQAELSTELKHLNVKQLPIDDIYCSPIPVSKGNYGNIKILKNEGFTHILLLLPELEYLQLLDADLPKLYADGGLSVVHLPIYDGSVPKREKLAEVLDQLIHKDPSSRYLIHCNGGIGRTGLVVACLAMQIFKIEPSEAIFRARGWVHPDVCKANPQRHFVENYANETIDAVSKAEITVYYSPSTIHALDLDLKGKLFCGPLPKVKEDSLGVIQTMQENQIQTVVLLLPKLEFVERTQCDLIEFYKEIGLQVEHFPIYDENIPEKEALDNLLKLFQEKLSEGENIYMHCLSGIGRTGLVAACLVGKIFGLNGEEAITLVRNQHNKYAVEKIIQQQFVKEYLG